MSLGIEFCERDAWDVQKSTLFGLNGHWPMRQSFSFILLLEITLFVYAFILIECIEMCIVAPSFSLSIRSVLYVCVRMSVCVCICGHTWPCINSVSENFCKIYCLKCGELHKSQWIEWVFLSLTYKQSLYFIPHQFFSISFLLHFSISLLICFVEIAHFMGFVVCTLALALAIKERRKRRKKNNYQITNERSVEIENSMLS